jgi:peptidoglycan/LPS O-acetylase OafA/YrhL
MESKCTPSPLPGTADPKTQPNRLDFIDALRALGAVYIVIYHLALIPVPNLGMPTWAKAIILSGGTGVTLFFILSAFTLMLSMRKREREPHSSMAFYLRRFFRIAPLFYVWILVSLIRDKVWFGLSHSAGTVLLSIFFGYNFVPGQQEGLVWASWILGVEILFYLIFPILYRYIDDLWKSLGFFFATVAVSGSFAYLITNVTGMDPAIRDSYLRYNFFHQLPIFAFGLVVYFIFERFIQNTNRPWGWSFVCIAASALLYEARLDGRLVFLMDDLYWQSLIYGALLIGLAIVPVKLMVNPVSCFLGEISYSIYLNHPTLVYAFIPIYRTIYSYRMPTTFQFGLCLFLTLGVVVVVSYLTYYFIEQPGIRVGGWIIKRIQRTPT